MSDDKVLDIKDYKKVNGEITKINPKKSKKSKKKSKKEEETEIEISVTFDDFEYSEEFDDQDYEDMLVEENEMLQVELLKERTARQALEKILNKHLKDSKKKDKPDGKTTDPNNTGSGKPKTT